MDTQQDLTPATETRWVHSFVAGYLRSRGQTRMAQSTTWPWGITVRYGPGMDRRVEHFVWDAQSGPEAAAPADGDWLTLFGDEPPSAAPAGFALRPLASETFMATELRALCRRLDGAESRLRTAPTMGCPSPDFAVFRHEAAGQTAASVRCALGLDGDAVLDRLATEPAHRGRGLARSLMRAAAGWALARGCARLLLIASPEGRALYGRLGFETLSSVHVFNLERQSHDH